MENEKRAPAGANIAEAPVSVAADGQASVSTVIDCVVTAEAIQYIEFRHAVVAPETLKDWPIFMPWPFGQEVAQVTVKDVVV